jgi:hypothetical protein
MIEKVRIGGKGGGGETGEAEMKTGIKLDRWKQDDDAHPPILYVTDILPKIIM